MEITKIFTFDSAHNLERYHGKCEALHGHTYTLEVTVKGLPKEDDMVMDFAELKRLVKTHVIDRLDHTYLNESLKINPTSENVVLWIWEVLAPLVAKTGIELHSIALWETKDSRVRLWAQDLG
jgi:6-pyruvoyltetrahydropterin/6-carboxytetrahydropterin synthase